MIEGRINQRYQADRTPQLHGRPKTCIRKAKRKIRKIFTKTGILCPRADVERLHVKREPGLLEAAYNNVTYAHNQQVTHKKG